MRRVATGRVVTGAFAALVVAAGASMIAAAPAGAVQNTSDGSAPSAITSMWAWGNPIDPATDARGLGEPQFEPAALVAFAQQHDLRSVYLSVPWAADQGAFATW